MLPMFQPASILPGEGKRTSLPPCNVINIADQTWEEKGKKRGSTGGDVETLSLASCRQKEKRKRFSSPSFDPILRRGKKKAQVAAILARYVHTKRKKERELSSIDNTHCGKPQALGKGKKKKK